MDQQAMGLPSKAAVLAAITHQQASNEWFHFQLRSSECVGYALLLIRILDEQNVGVDIRRKVLLQLKRHISQGWAGNAHSIAPQEKLQVKASIIPSIFGAPLEYSTLKLYRETLTIIAGKQFYRNWNPLQDISERIVNGSSFPHCMQIILAIAAACQSNKKVGKWLFFIQNIFPTLQLISNSRQSREIYFSVKLLCKVAHVQRSQALNILILQSMPTLLSIIESKNPAFDSQPSETQEKWSEQFYYFHSKKWATRTFLKFIQRYAKTSEDIGEDRRKFAEKWYTNFGDRFFEVLLKEFSVKTTKKVRIFQLKCLKRMIAQCPQRLLQYAPLFQFEILPSYVKLSERDEELAQRSPTQFTEQQTKPSISHAQLRFVATKFWIEFHELINKKSFEEKSNKQQTLNMQSLSHLLETLRFIEGKLSENDDSQKELALYLFAKMGSLVRNQPQYHNFAEKHVVKYVIPNFEHTNFLVRSRALEAFSAFEFLKLSKEAIGQSIEGVIRCTLKEQHGLVQINAIKALIFMVEDSSAKRLLSPFLKQIIVVLLELIQRYSGYKMVHNLSMLLKRCGPQVFPIASSVIHRLAKIFLQANVSQIQANHNSFQQEFKAKYKQICSTPKMCLKCITIILQYPLSHQIILQSESIIIEILQSTISIKNVDIFRYSLKLLTAYLFKVKVLNESLFFFYQALIQKLIGICPNLKYINATLSQKQTSILYKLRGNQDIRMLHYSLQPLIAYISKVSQMANQENSEFFKNCLICLLFHLISEIYKKVIQRKSHFSYEQEITIICCCASLMISLLSNFKTSLPKNVYVQIWQFLKINMQKYQSWRLKQKNSQLIGLLLSVDPLNILAVIQRQNMIKRTMFQITSLNYQHPLLRRTHNLDQQDASFVRTHIIQGITSVLLMKQQLSFVMPFMKDLFKTCLKLVSENIYGINITANQYGRPAQIINVNEYRNENQANQQRQDGRPAQISNGNEQGNENQESGSDGALSWQPYFTYCESEHDDESSCLLQFQKLLLKMDSEEDDLGREIISSVPANDLAILIFTPPLRKRQQ